MCQYASKNKIFYLYLKIQSKVTLTSLFSYALNSQLVNLLQIQYLRSQQMRIQIKSEGGTACELFQSTEQYNQQYKSSSMQNNFFNSKSPHRTQSKLLQQELSQKQTPIIPPLQEEDYSNNVLNMGFIADDSQLVFSDSRSINSEGFSNSAISVIRGKPRDSPRIIINFDEEISGISGMDEWSHHSKISLTKGNFKRNKPETIQDEGEQLQTHLTKKKMNEKNKVVTIDNSRKSTQSRGYMLRSKSKPKALDEESSSNEDIREILVNMQKHQNNSKSSKNKGNQKQAL